MYLVVILGVRRMYILIFWFLHFVYSLVKCKWSQLQTHVILSPGLQWNCMTPGISRELKLPAENTFNAKICLNTFVSNFRLRVFWCRVHVSPGFLEKTRTEGSLWKLSIHIFVFIHLPPTICIQIYQTWYNATFYFLSPETSISLGLTCQGY